MMGVCILLGCESSTDESTIGSTAQTGGAQQAAQSSGQGGSLGDGGSGQGGVSGSPLLPSLIGMNLVIDCSPSAPADPVAGFYTAKYDNEGGLAPATATIVSSALEVTNGAQPDLWTFDADPLSSGAVAAGASESISHDKVVSTLSGTMAPCSFCTRGSSWSLKVTWNVGGSEVTDSIGPSGTTCNF